MTGQRVCKMHGGKSPGAQERAAERVLEQAADTELRKLWVGLGDAVAVKDPVESMARLAGALEHFLEEIGAKVNHLNHVAAGKDLSALRGEIVLWEKVAGMLSRLLDSMARLGIAERQIELEAEQAQAVISAFLGAVGAVSLLPADRDLVVRRFLEGLGVDAGALQLEAGGAV